MGEPERPVGGVVLERARVGGVREHPLGQRRGRAPQRAAALLGPAGGTLADVLSVALGFNLHMMTSEPARHRSSSVLTCAWLLNSSFFCCASFNASSPRLTSSPCLMAVP